MFSVMPVYQVLFKKCYMCCILKYVIHTYTCASHLKKAQGVVLWLLYVVKLKQKDETKCCFPLPKWSAIVLIICNIQLGSERHLSC